MQWTRPIGYSGAFPALGRGILILTIWVGMTVAGTASAATVDLPPDRDATLFMDSEGDVASGSGPGLFAGNNSGGNTRRTVLRFSLAGIPDGSVIEGVDLLLTVDSAPVPDTVVVTAHRLLASWGEGGSAADGGQGAIAQVGDATWLHRFYPDSAWTAPGGDFDPAILAEAEVGPAGEHAWSTPELIVLVQTWLDTPESNHGLLLQGEEGSTSTVRRFGSREATDPGLRPRLVVTYSPGTSPSRSTTWGSLKSGYRDPGSGP